MKILSAIIIPPHLSASGAVNAAMAMSHALTRHCDVEVAIMANETRCDQVEQLKVWSRRADNWLSFTQGWLPNKFRTLLYRSDIASMVGNYDLVHLHNPIPALEMKRIAKACVAKKIPYVLTTHGFVEIYDIKTAYRLGALEAIAGRLLVTRPSRLRCQTRRPGLLPGSARQSNVGKTRHRRQPNGSDSKWGA